MQPDFYRLAAVFAIALILGLISGQLFASLFLASVYLLYREYRTLKQLLRWMRRRNLADEPDEPGIFEAIARQYEDLSDRHKKQKKKLAGYLKRFKEVTQSLPDAVVVLGPNDEIEWANRRAEMYLGVRNPQDRGQRLVNLFRHPSLITLMRDTRGDQRISEKSLELVSPVNSEIHLELRLVSYGDSGKLLVARDITKIYRINRMRTDFIANASHELRTPLTVIAGYLESFEDEFSGEEGEPGRSRIRQMRRQAERMRRLIEDLLKLSMLETTENESRREPVRVPDLLQTVVDEARALSGGQQHRFHIDADPTLWIEGDRNQIYSAISNVVFNAVQHTPDQGSITLRWHTDSAGAILEVIDTGEGISEEHIPRLTERFYRVDRGRSREKGGTGLGLAIVKHILARHNARLEIESKPAVGSTFRFRFPAALILRKDMIDNRNLPGKAASS